MPSREVSTMIKQGFISDPAISCFSPSRLFKVSPSSSPAMSLSPSHPDPPRPASTLFDMMSDEQQRDATRSDEKRRKMQERVGRVLADALRQNPRWGGCGDVKLTVASKDGFRISMDVHKRVLVDRSRFFAEKLARDGALSHEVEILDCDDIDVYVETVLLMYCEDLKKRLIGEAVSRVLGLLKVSAAILFDAGVMSCLDYLEAVPWPEDQEEKVIAILGELELDEPASEVLQRVSVEDSSTATMRADTILPRLLTGVLQAHDNKARQDMKSLISKLLSEDHHGVDVSKDTLYHLCYRCLSSLILCLSEASGRDEGRRDRGVLMGEIAREADNMQWIVDILIVKKMGDEFVKVWAEQKELAALHSKIPTMYRHEISKVTAQLCIAIGRGSVLVPKDTRFGLLSTWLGALYEDFGWMRRACRSVDKKLVEDGVGQTILTLPLEMQQSLLLNWFDQFLNRGDDCPNIRKAFEVWWRRAFVRQAEAGSEGSKLQITCL